MRYARPEAIVSTFCLAEHLRDPALRINDCTTHLHYETQNVGNENRTMIGKR